MSGDIGFEEAERRRLAFAARGGRRGGAGASGRARSVFASHGTDGRSYMVELAVSKLEQDALARSVETREASSRSSKRQQERTRARSAALRRATLQAAAACPVVHRACSVVVLSQLAAHGTWGWAAIGFFLLGAAGVVEGCAAGWLCRARNVAMPVPEMTRDEMGKRIPRTMHDCHCPLSVVVRLPAARDLAAMDFGGTSDPYVIVKLFGRKKAGKGKLKWIEIDRRRTKTIDRTLDPQWDATFEFANPRRFGSSWLKLTFEVFDEDTLGDDLIGECSLPDLSFLEEGDGTFNDWEQLFMEDGDEAGELQVLVEAKFTEEDSIRGAFERLDDDGSGELERDEIAELMTQIGKPLSQKKLDQMMIELDADGSGQVDFDEFFEWYVDHVAEGPKKKNATHPNTKSQ